MEKRLNTKIEEYITKFKDEIRNKMIALNMEDKSKGSDLLQYIYDYDRLCLQKDDFVKRKRVKNSIPNSNRCIAKRANSEQCTRRRKTDCEFCGTHSKGTPHGVIQSNSSTNVTHKVELFATEIRGIVYYLDSMNNVYKTEDVLDARENPRVVAKYVKIGDTYTIPELGVV
jgi:hypothetical protein